MHNMFIIFFSHAIKSFTYQRNKKLHISMCFAAIPQIDIWLVSVNIFCQPPRDQNIVFLSLKNRFHNDNTDGKNCDPHTNLLYWDINIL